MLRRKYLIWAMVLLLVLPVFSLGLAPGAALAQDAGDSLWGGEEKKTAIKTATGLGEKDPREVAAQVINIILGFLGIIAVILIIYGGFLWMTAAGNEDKVSTAKKLLAAGVVGLIIILAAFGIANFVINALMGATGAGA